MLHAISHRHGGPDDRESVGRIVLTHDERHLRRKTLTLEDGTKLLVDLPEAAALEHGDLLVLEDGRTVDVIAADEELYEVRAEGWVPLARLAWHLGNRHLPTQIEADRILIERDHVIKAMLERLGATVRETVDWFQPVRGAYSGHGQGHSHSPDEGHEHARGEDHGHSRGE